MSKVLVVVLSAVGAVVVIGGVTYFIIQNNTKSDTTNNQNTSQQSSNNDIALVDPNGDYKAYSDTSITEHPADGFVFGGDTPFAVTYDGSKSENDQYAKLSYQLYYIQDNGTVVNFTGGNLYGPEGKGEGVFTTEDDVFTSDADGRKGFVEVVVTYGTKFDDATQTYKGTTNKLGMYPVTFKVSE